MSIAGKPTLTSQEYLAIEREAEHRSEYYAGEMFAMAGASLRRNRVTANLVQRLGAQLEGGPCQALSSDMRVKVTATGLYTYPDVLIVCGEPLVEDAHGDTLLNPQVVIEVLSPSTEAYDRGAKFIQYRRMASLQEYVLVAQDRMRVEHYQRHEQSEQWLLTEWNCPDDVMRLPSAGCGVPLAQVYAGVDLSLPEPDEQRP